MPASQLTIESETALKIYHLAEKVNGNPQTIVNALLRDSLDAIHDDRDCEKNSPREHLVPISINILRVLTSKEPTLFFNKGANRCHRPNQKTYKRARTRP